MAGRKTEGSVFKYLRVADEPVAFGQTLWAKQVQMTRVALDSETPSGRRSFLSATTERRAVSRLGRTCMTVFRTVSFRPQLTECLNRNWARERSQAARTLYLATTVDDEREWRVHTFKKSS